MQTDKKIWFPAKRYGWGWGLPVAWQGYAVLAGYLAAMLLGAMRISPDRHMNTFVVYTLVLSVALVGICWLKGEPPRWRWGKD